MPRYRLKTAEERAGERRRAVGLRSQRDGYPALFLGTAAITKMLVEVAALEPVFIEDLPDRQDHARMVIFIGLRRALNAGIIRRYRQESGHERPMYALDQRHPFAPQIRAVLRSIGVANGLRIARHAPEPLDESRAYVGKSTKQPRPLFRGVTVPTDALLGRTNRTTAIVAVATLGHVDHSTISRLVGIPPGRRMIAFIDPIVADGIFEVDDDGLFKMCRLPEAPWVPPLKALTEAMIENNPTLESLLDATRVMMKSGVRRKYLRRRYPEI